MCEAERVKSVGNWECIVERTMAEEHMNAVFDTAAAELFLCLLPAAFFLACTKQIG
jgi:hypothetical protein